ncbi:LysM peptidoglycan-binding domain-containing protein [Prosthecobacter sp.]|uniref:LysM peptidoglycan-binding domain-containing protein n=1 Tax=Prosthecobacter sp. TaxID=1965333 RepID=UPI0037840391
MKTPCPASRMLSTLVLSWALATVTALPLSAQVSHTYTQPPPPGYPAPGAPARSTTTRPTSTKAPSSRTTRQSAAAIQTPVTHPQYPTTYPPPPGYTYPPPPPGYGTAPRTSAPKSSASKSTASKTTTTGKSSSTKSTSPKAGPPPPPKVYGPTGDLTNQVTKIRDSDRVQNMRIGDLERDVSSIKRGGKGSTRYDGGSDLPAYTTYVTRPGDTLWRIASTHRVSVGEIQQLNRMTEDEVHVGQTLLIPSPHRAASSAATTQASYTPSTPGGAPPPPPSSAGPAATTTVKVTAPLYYTVKKGDSLKAIALRHKIAPTALASANKIKDVNKIIVGQRLKIPGRTTTSTVTVAAKSKTPSRTESTDTVPLPGYGVGVPGAPPPPASGLGLTAAPAPAAAPAAPPAPAPAAATPKSPDTTDSHRGILAYRVDRSDTIETIATQFTTTPDKIREMNRLTPGSTLKPGDEIMVPAMGAVSVSTR